MKYLLLPLFLFVLLSCEQQKKQEIIKDEKTIEQKRIDTPTLDTIKFDQIAEKDTNQAITSSYNRPKRVIDSIDEYQSHIEKFPHHALVPLSDR